METEQIILGILPIVYEFIARRIKTKKNRSLIFGIGKVLDFVIGNRAKEFDKRNHTVFTCKSYK